MIRTRFYHALAFGLAVSFPVATAACTAFTEPPTPEAIASSAPLRAATRERQRCALRLPSLQQPGRRPHHPPRLPRYPWR